MLRLAQVFISAQLPIFLIWGAFGGSHLKGVASELGPQVVYFAAVPADHQSRTISKTVQNLVGNNSIRPQLKPRPQSNASLA